MNIYDTHKQAFSFHQGSVFSNILLADEINRSNPKTQSALLEAMEEKQVTIDGETYPLPRLLLSLPPKTRFNNPVRMCYLNHNRIDSLCAFNWATQTGIQKNKCCLKHRKCSAANAANHGVSELLSIQHQVTHVRA